MVSALFSPLPRLTPANKTSFLPQVTFRKLQVYNIDSPLHHHQLTIFLAFFLTAHFSEEDFPYDWLMLWLSRRPEWQRSREFETTTRTALPGGSSSSSAAASSSTYRSAEDDDWDQWEVAVSGNSGSNNIGGPGEDGEGRPKTRVVFQPTYDSTHTIFYKGHWLRVRRGRKQETGSEMLSIR